MLFTKLTNTISLNNSWIIIFYSRCLLNFLSYTPNVLLKYRFCLQSFRLFVETKHKFKFRCSQPVWVNLCVIRTIMSNVLETSFSVPVNSFAIGLLFPLLIVAFEETTRKCTLVEPSSTTFAMKKKRFYFYILF